MGGGGGNRIPGTDERMEAIQQQVVSIQSSTGLDATIIAEEEEEPTTTQLQQLSSPTAITRNTHKHNNSNNDQHSFWFVTVPLALFLLVFVVTDLLVTMKRLSARWFLTLTLAGMIICGASSAFATAGIVATSGIFPANIGINPFVSGQAIGGVVVSVANFFAAAAEDPKDYWKQHCSINNSTTTLLAGSAAAEEESLSSSNSVTAGTSSSSSSSSASEETIHTTCPPYEKLDKAVFLYFFVGAIVLLCCIIGFSILNNQGPEYETVHNSEHQQQEEEEEEEQGAIASAAAASSFAVSETFQDEPSPRYGLELRPTTTARPTNHVYENESIDGHGQLRRMTSDDNTGGVRTSATSSSIVGVFRAICCPAFCIYFTFLVTLALFPSWTSHLRSTEQCQNSASRFSRFQNDLFVPFTFVLFNLGDLVGRILAGWMIDINKIVSNNNNNNNNSKFSSKLIVATLSRCWFFLLLPLCASGAVGGHHHRLQIQSDFYSLLVQTLFALSNGFLISLGFMYAPTLIPSQPQAQERSSEILTLSLSLGLLCGSLLSFPLVKLAS